MDDSQSQTHDTPGLLDLAFEEAMERIEEGLPVDPAELIAQRPDLLPEVTRLVRLAQQVAVGQNRTIPTVPGYTILGELGHGGMGAVYLARQERLGGRPVALKMLPPSVALSGQARQRFRAEAHAIARLHHPNIVAVHDVVEEAGVFAYAMEWVEGKSLADLIDHLKRLRRETRIEDVSAFLGSGAEAIGVPTIAVYVCQLGVALGRALAEVHRAGLLHRDVKPSNILLRRDGTPLLSDFGLARETDATMMTQTGHFVGTPAYAAPEQLRGDAHELSPQTDVYGLGVTLYHALALRIPFQETSTAGVLRQIEVGRAIPLRRINPRLPADLQTIVAKAMEPEPRRRYSSADELADDLERLLRLEPIHARPAGTMTRVIKLARRNRAAVLGAASGGVLALILAVVVGGYVFVVPDWVEAHVRDAHLALLEPGRNDVIFGVVYWQNSPRKPGGAGEDFLRAPLSSYQAALRLQPTNRAIRLERDIVQLARDLARHSDRMPATSAGLRADARLACTYAEQLAESTGLPRLESQLLEHASANELRSLGLLAYLCGDVNTALRAWSQMDLQADPDPLVEASLGQLYLLRDEPARAYPRLRNAFRAFPDAGFLCVSLADAALQCGDLAKAETLLMQARGMDRLDPTFGMERVQADLYAATGRDELAIAIWTSEATAQTVAQCHYAQYLEAHGDLEGATRAHGYAGGVGRYRRAWDGFGRVAPRWWSGLTTAERWRTLRDSLHQPPAAHARHSLVFSLWNFAEYSLLPLAGEQKPVSAPPGSLEAIALGLHAPDAIGPRRFFLRYPSWLMDLHATVLLSPWPVCGSLALAVLDAASRRLDLPSWTSAEPPRPTSVLPRSGP